MKQFETPVLEVVTFDVADVITASGTVLPDQEL